MLSANLNLKITKLKTIQKKRTYQHSAPADCCGNVRFNKNFTIVIKKYSHFLNAQANYNDVVIIIISGVVIINLCQYL